MKKILFIISIVFIISCGDGTGNITPKENNLWYDIRSENSFLYHENKEIVIYNNFSEDSLKKFIEFHKSSKVIYEFSNPTQCKTINSNYIQAKINNTYSLNGFIACSNYDISNRRYKGNKTYLIIYGDLKMSVNNAFPPLHSNFGLMFGVEEKEKIMPIFKKQYDINELKKDDLHLIWISRNVNEKGLEIMMNNDSSYKTFIYKLPVNQTISCEGIGHNVSDKEIDNVQYKQYQTRRKRCIETKVLESDNLPRFGDDTYISKMFYIE